MPDYLPAKYTAINSTSTIPPLTPNQSDKETKNLSGWKLRGRKFYRKLVGPWWAWEIFAAIVSLLATISLVIVLSQVDKQKQQFWAVGGTQLTINTIVAGLGTVLRTALLLAVAGALNQGAWNWFASSVGQHEFRGRPLKDLETFSDASANSWNCIKLLWRTRCRYLITIGALVMILSLAFDAFLQQILSTEQRTQIIPLARSNLTTNNVLPRSTGYNRTNELVANPNIGFETGSIYEDNALELSYWTSKLTAALIENEQPSLQANCPTGGCSWPVTPSLAVCHECKAVKTAVSHTSSAKCSNITAHHLLNHPDNDITTRICEKDSDSAEWMMFVDTPLETDSGVPVNSTIFTLYSVGVPNGEPQPPWDFFAYECSISFCIKGFTGTLSGASYQLGAIQDVALEGHYVPDHTTGASVGKFVNVPATLNVGEPDSITFDPMFHEMLGKVAFGLFRADVSVFYNASALTGQNSDELAKLLHAGGSSLDNITAMAGKVSDTITNYIRTTSHEELDSRYAPSVQVLVPTIVVRWPWLTYVLVLQASGLLFLLLTMRATKRRQVRAWKGHRMALLLAELDPALQSQAQGGLANRTGLDDRIGDIKVRLEFDGDNKIAFRPVEEKAYRRRAYSELRSWSEIAPHQTV